MTPRLFPPDDPASLIITKALQCGADLAGIASVEDLRRSPSHRVAQLLPEYTGVGTLAEGDGKRGAVRWPSDARSAIVLAVAHPEDEPELDWWLGDGASGDTPGNKSLIAAVGRLADWLEAEHGVCCHRIAYHVERGGAYMKDAAMLAGIGRVGINNLLLTREFGPRHRLRVLLPDAVLPSTGPPDWDPCEGCPAPCRAACPRGAFRGAVYTMGEYGIAELPGRDGAFDRRLCNLQMQADEKASELTTMHGHDAPAYATRYCRACELACIAGER